MAVNTLPKHLERYVVEQDYSRYTPVDQAVWRHIMRQLRAFLAVHAHPCYLDGLVKTGIEIDRIPRIDVMNEKLEKFGWRAVPVSGFIPPAAFMELQSLGVLPIASDMRSLDHLLYTPAPDIVHEAAGHAPILVDPAFAHYLKSYAQIARRAIISREDMNQYDAIRVLSDIKENPGSTTSQIKQAEDQLQNVTSAMRGVSEAAILGRMNWWTAEYGLIGSLKDPKIFGAGLLSSIGESRAAMGSTVKKIPLSIECINFSYDITEQQPQLFVVSNFEKLTDVLDELTKKMAFKIGGVESLEKAVLSETVNTIELDTGLQISGMLKSIKVVDAQPAYLILQGPTQLSLDGHELVAQGVDCHRHGFGSPIGRTTVEGRDGKSSLIHLGALSRTEVSRIGIQPKEKVILNFESGVVVSGKIEQCTFSPKTDRLLILTLVDVSVNLGSEILFDPSWGRYDMAVGQAVSSVQGGPADRSKFGDTDDFTRKIIPRTVYQDSAIQRHNLYQQVRALRESGPSVDLKLVEKLLAAISKDAATDWLLLLEIQEIAEKHFSPSLAKEKILGVIQTLLAKIVECEPKSASLISDGQKIMHLESQR